MRKVIITYMIGMEGNAYVSNGTYASQKTVVPVPEDVALPAKVAFVHR
ncbi:MAG: hypothetical protein NVSMB49_20050 [Ktedonobacteraceae bacterium]